MSYVVIDGCRTYHTDEPNGCWRLEDSKRKRSTARLPMKSGRRPCRICLPNDPWHNPSVYFARIEDPGRDWDGWIKIGCSATPKARVGGQQTMFGKLVLIATTPGGFDIEKSFHNVFADERRLWELFDPSPRLMAYIDSLREQEVAA